MCDGDGEQLPLARLPEVVVQLVCGHLIVQHEVDGGREVSQSGSGSWSSATGSFCETIVSIHSFLM